MKTNKMFPSKYLKAADLDGKSRIVVIKDVIMEVLGQGDEAEEKPVVYFEDGKPLALNKTNCNVIEDSLGEESDDWIDHELDLYPDRVPFKGKMVDAIRVRVTAALSA